MNDYKKLELLKSLYKLTCKTQDTLFDFLKIVLMILIFSIIVWNVSFIIKDTKIMLLSSVVIFIFILKTKIIKNLLEYIK